LPNGTRNYPDADRRIMRGYQARAHVGRGSLCVMLFTDWGCDGRRVSSLPRIPAQQRPPCLGSLPSREGLKVSGCRIDRNDLDLVFDASFRERRRRRKALVGQITPDERIDCSGPPGLAPVSQEIADRQSPRLLPQHCDIGQAVAAAARSAMIFPGSWTARGAQLVDDLSHAPTCPRQLLRGASFDRPENGRRTPRQRRGHEHLQRSWSLDDDRGASMPTRGSGSPPPEPACAQRQGIATLATTCC